MGNQDDNQIFIDPICCVSLILVIANQFLQSVAEPAMHFAPFLIIRAAVAPVKGLTLTIPVKVELNTCISCVCGKPWRNLVRRTNCIVGHWWIVAHWSLQGPIQHPSAVGQLCPER